jgi:uncharacterized protein YceK
VNSHFFPSSVFDSLRWERGNGGVLKEKENLEGGTNNMLRRKTHESCINFEAITRQVGETTKGWSWTGLNLTHTQFSFENLLETLVLPFSISPRYILCVCVCSDDEVVWGVSEIRFLGRRKRIIDRCIHPYTHTHREKRI